ncbi:SIR2 family protein [Primorskyibacter marinus]|uniref:SIR2 family protein n=1 Tax=Primorskyibacter marinus TaxID=1977320 RepID=UPI000E306EB5|nr:SIR2 family protein [Primorskyibacter marinus]
MPFPENFDTERCLLFLGSGFSAAATNKRSGNPPVGNGLQKTILSEIDEENADIDLKDAASYAARRGVDLYGLLHELFVITGLNDEQKTILDKPWRRIYTTNYDDAVEFFEKDRGTGNRRSSFSIDDERPRKFPSNSVVHLHGYIHSCDKKNVLSQLVLDHRSYSEQAALASPWWDQFERDIQGAQWIIFVGYNLNDFAVSKYLTKDPRVSQKTRFILRDPVRDYIRDRLEGYGAVDTIETSGFAQACANAKTHEPISNFNQLQAFRLIDPYKDNKAVARPTPVEIETFLTRGNYNFQSLASTYPKAEFALPRKAKITEAIEALSDSKTLLLHSRTANGKSIFADMLSLELSAAGKSCVRYTSHSDIPPSEIEFLSQVNDLVVFFRTYDDVVAMSDEVAELRANATFIVEINTGTDQVRRSEVHSFLPSPIGRLDLNPFERKDRQDFGELLSRSGIPSEGLDLSGTGRTELRDHLVDLLKSPYVKERLSKAIKPLLDDKEAMKVIATACVMRAFSIHVGIDFIRAITGGDPFDILLKNEIAALEFGSLSPDSLALHSAVFSEYFLKEHVGSHGTVSVICRLAIEAAKRKKNGANLSSQRSREARKALGALLQYGRVSSLLGFGPEGQKSITDLYETLRDNIIINDEPLFWLQYSIFMQDLGNYSMARKHLESAYLRAEATEGFRTYQLDTNYLKLILQAPADEDDFPGDTEILFDLIDKVHNMLSAPDHRVHAIRVLEDIKVFCVNHGADLTDGERQRLSIQCLGIVGTLEALNLGIKTEFETDRSKVAVIEAVTLLAAGA